MGNNAIPVGLQLYSVRRALGQDFAGTLSAVKAMGYDGVEFAAGQDMPPAQIREALEAAGLLLLGWHLPYQYFLPEHWDETIAYHQAVGNQYLVCPRAPAWVYQQGLSGYARLAQTLAAAAEAFGKEGLAAGYHNHEQEFEPIDGTVPWQFLYNNTPPECILQVDVGNVLAARGMSPKAAALATQQYPGRTLSLHLKGYGKQRGFAPAVGDADDDVPLPLAIQSGVHHGKANRLVIEYACEEDGAYPPMEGARRCIENVRALQKSGCF